MTAIVRKAAALRDQKELASGTDAHFVLLFGLWTFIKANLLTHLEEKPTIAPLSAADEIRALAAKHDVKPFRSELDDWADAVTRLSGDDVQLDDVEELLIALRRANVIDGETCMTLFGRYAKERRAARN